MLTTLFSSDGRKAFVALVTSVVGYGLSVGLLDPGTAQTVVAVASGLVNVVGVFYATNTNAPA